MTDETFTHAIRDKVTNWLVQEGYQVEPSPPHDDFHWRVRAQDKGGRRFVLAQQTGHVDRVLIESSATVSEEQKPTLELMSIKQQESILLEIKLELLRMGVDYNNFQAPITRLNVSDAIYFEGAFDNALAKDTFFSRIEQIRRGLMMVLIILKRRIEEATSS